MKYYVSAAIKAAVLFGLTEFNLLSLKGPKTGPPDLCIKLTKNLKE
jgi:hypothetical protein